MTTCNNLARNVRLVTRYFFVSEYVFKSSCLPNNNVLLRWFCLSHDEKIPGTVRVDIQNLRCLRTFIFKFSESKRAVILPETGNI